MEGSDDSTAATEGSVSVYYYNVRGVCSEASVYAYDSATDSGSSEGMGEFVSLGGVEDVVYVVVCSSGDVYGKVAFCGYVDVSGSGVTGAV